MNFKNLISEKSTLTLDMATNENKSYKGLTNFQFSSMSDDISGCYAPSVFYFNDMKYIPCVKFDRNLMVIEDRNSNENVLLDPKEQLTPIPKFIAYLVLELRSKFEEELKDRICFLESQIFPEKKDIEDMAEKIFFYSKYQKNIRIISENASALLLFCVLLELLQKFEHSILQFSKEINMLSLNENLKKYCRPFDFIISEQAYNFIDKVYLRKELEPKKRIQKDEDPCLKRLGELVNSYYIHEERVRKVDLTIRNQFHLLLYRDIRQTRSSMQRYLSRFILRQFIYILRRYICSVSARLRILRKESWDIMSETVLPQITAFAVHKISEFLACTIIEITDGANLLNDKVTLLENIFSLHLECIWFRRKRISDMVESTELPNCHNGCLCGMG